MTIELNQELKRKEAELIEKLMSEIRSFEQETKLTVSGINLQVITRTYGGAERIVRKGLTLDYQL
jgi:hypothetical protein